MGGFRTRIFAAILLVFTILTLFTLFLYRQRDGIVIKNDLEGFNVVLNSKERLKHIFEFNDKLPPANEFNQIELALTPEQQPTEVFFETSQGNKELYSYSFVVENKKLRIKVNLNKNEIIASGRDAQFIDSALEMILYRALSVLKNSALVLGEIDTEAQLIFQSQFSADEGMLFRTEL